MSVTLNLTDDEAAAVAHAIDVEIQAVGATADDADGYADRLEAAREKLEAQR